VSRKRSYGSQLERKADWAKEEWRVLAAHLVERGFLQAM